MVCSSYVRFSACFEGGYRKSQISESYASSSLAVVIFCLLSTIVAVIGGTYIDTGKVIVFTDFDTIIFGTCVMNAVLLPIMLIGVWCMRLYLPDE